MTRIQSPRRRRVQQHAINPISITWAITVADHLSFRSAARQLGVRHASVSRRVGALEDALGISLFERSRGGLKITNAGAEFFREAREAFRQLQHASRLAAEAGRGRAGHLSIGIQSSIGAGFLRDLLRVYSERHPDVVIEIVEGPPPAEHISLVQRRQIDVTFVGTTTGVTDCDIAPLWNERLFVVLPHGHKLSKRAEVEWHTLRNERLIVRQAKCDSELCERLIGHISNRVRSPAIQKLTVGRETLMHLVAIGRGITITSEATLATAYPNVIFRPISGEDEIIRFNAVWSPENDNPALRRLLSLARGRAK